MASKRIKSVIKRAKALYVRTLKYRLEGDHPEKYVAIEPISEEHFIGATVEAAREAARAKYPTRLSHTIRIGKRAPFRPRTGSSSSRPNTPRPNTSRSNTSRSNTSRSNSPRSGSSRYGSPRPNSQRNNNYRGNRPTGDRQG